MPDDSKRLRSPFAMQTKSLFARIAPPIAALVALVFLVNFARAPVETLKWIGAPFMVLPTALGMMPGSGGAIQPVALKEASPALEVAAPGRYALYAADEIMQMRSNMLADANAAWVRVRPLGADASAGAAVEITGSVIKRGAAIYDPVSIPGRPVVSFLIPTAGTYELVYPRQSGVLYFAPDWVTGREGVLGGMIVAQLAVIAALITVLAWPRIRVRREQARLAAEALAKKRAASAEFVRGRGQR